LQHLCALPALDFVDVRGTGVARAALLPLEKRFGLWQPQAAVLARSNALAAAAVGGALFPCACAAVGVALAGGGAVRARDSAGDWQLQGAALGQARGGAGVVQAARPMVGRGRREQLLQGGAARPEGVMLRGILALLHA
jgi:hypothetical protein